MDVSSWTEKCSSFTPINLISLIQICSLTSYKAIKQSLSFWKIFKSNVKFYLETLSMISASNAFWKIKIFTTQWKEISTKKYVSLLLKNLKHFWLVSSMNWDRRESASMWFNSSEEVPEYPPSSMQLMKFLVSNLPEQSTQINVLRKEQR